MNAAFSALPSIVSLLIALVVANAAAFGVTAAVRHYARRVAIAHGSPLIGAWATATGSLCALLFTFTIVTLWNGETRASAGVDAEALALRSVARDVKPEQLPDVAAYVRASVAEWPTLCGGGNVDDSRVALDRLERSAAPKGREYEDDLFRQLSSVEVLRAQRLHASHSGVPIELWIALIAMSLAILTVLAFSLFEHPGYTAALTIVFASAIGALFWVAGLLDFPFCGGTSVSAQPLLDVLHAFGSS